MIQWSEGPIYMHRTPVDFRKSINGLLMIVESDMALSPFSESLFVFGNASRDKIKILYWDKTGFCLCDRHGWWEVEQRRSSCRV